MDLENKKSVKETYAKLLKVGFGEGAIEEMPQFIAEDVMGYGTALDEKIMSIEEFIELINDQRRQSKDFDDFQYTSNPVIIRMADNGQSAVIVDEIELVTVIDGKSNLLPLRMSTVMELKDGTWKITHWHGSLAEHVSDGEDPWHITQWKQKTEKLARLVDEKTADLEVKNRELEIEAALERVRTAAMTMKQHNDMVDVCRIISDQLEMLGVKHIRNVQTAVINEQNETYLNYQYYTAYKKSTIEELDYNKHPKVTEMVKEMKRSTDAFFGGSMTGEELDEFRSYRKKDNQFPDPLLDESSALYYNFYSIGQGGLGLSTYKNLTKEKLAIFKRFYKVFTLAYRRFKDIQQAESQAREAQIEAGLERARAQSMMMQHSEELNKTSQVFHEQLRLLDIDSEFSYLWLPDEDKNEHLFWATWQEREKGSDSFKNKQVIYPLDKSEPAIAECYVAWESDVAIHVNPVPAAGVEEYFNTWTELLEGVDKFKPELYPDGLYYVDAYMKYGCFGIMIRKLLSEEEQRVLHRFSMEFERAYTRFLDLKKAEEQAREAQVELALERIRARVTAMQESFELLDIVVIMQAEFTKLGHEAHYFWHMRWLPDKYEKALTNGDGTRIGNVLELPRGFHGLKTMLDWEKTDEPSAVFALDPETAADYIDKMIKLGRFKEIDHSAPDPDGVRAMGGLTFVMARTTHGEIGYTLPGEVPKPPEQDIATLIRFASVFDLAYRRFEDLKSAELQNRETQIELALERVRSKAMAMHSSEDLGITVDTFFSELKGLGVSPHRCGVGIVDGKTRIVKIQAIDTNSDQETKKIVGDLKLAGHPVLEKIFEHWKNQEEYYPVLRGREIEEYYNVMNPQVTFHSFADDEVQYGYYFYFKEGGVYAWTDTDLQEQDLQIFRKYTSVLSLTYRRYLDLKDAEAKTREAIKQSSLDRIRGQIASMRTATDLQQITPLMWNELKNLEVPFFRCGIFIVDAKNKHVKVYLTTPEGKSLGVLDLDFDMSDLTRDTVKSWRKKEVYQTHWNRNEFMAWTREMMKLNQINTPEEYQGDDKPPESLHLHFIPFSQGMLYVGNKEQLEDEKIELVQSLAEAFSFAYARYEDFVILEEAKEQVEKALSELKSTQTQLIHAEKMASLGELTAGIAHEIQNPLNFVNNFSEVNAELIEELKGELEKGDLEEARFITADLAGNEEKIKHHGKRADSIVKGMLQHSRTTSGDKEPTDIKELADEYLRLAYHGLRARDKSFNADFKLDADENLPEVDVVAQDIGRVLLNLINNAFYAVDKKAKRGNQAYRPIVEVSITKTNQLIEIGVRDNGDGIPSGIKDKIFQPFFTTKPTGEGTGLGLSLSYDIISKGHGGELKVESTEGEGTKFIVRLPVT
jgi:signal transduction histidine kinase